MHGASLRAHPAPYPKEIAYRLIRMFSFAGDKVLDPFVGTGTTTLAAIDAGRNSLGVEADPGYIALAHRNIEHAAHDLWGSAALTFEDRTENALLLALGA